MNTFTPSPMVLVAPMLFRAIVAAAEEWRRQGGRYALTAAEREDIAQEFASYGVTVNDVAELASDLGVEVVA